jgi:hypothetical protein
MRTLAYALAGCLILLAPAAAADTPAETPDSIRTPGQTGCTVFAYQLDPPAYRLDPDCLERQT